MATTKIGPGVGSTGTAFLIARPATSGAQRLTTISTSIFSHFNSEFSVSRPSVPIAWDGVPFDPETDVPAGASWVRISVLPGDRRRVTLGPTPRRRRVGIISVQTFSPLGDGLLDATAISDDVEAAFDGATISGLRLFAPRTERVGPAGGWYQMNTLTPFHRDDES